MADAIESLIDRRKRTRAYVKSGWLKSIRDIERAEKGRAKRPPRNVQRFSRMPGQGKPARFGLNPTAEVINHATAATKIAGRALQQAINADAKDMRDFTAKRMQQTADKFSPRKIGRNRGTTAGERMATVIRQRDSGQTVTQFARSNNIGVSTLRKYIRESNRGSFR